MVESKPSDKSVPAVPTGFTAKYDQKAIEAEITGMWEKEGIPTKISQQRVGKKAFFLLDGPPYANAQAHVGHVKTTTCKDIWSRFKLMQGFDSLFLPGFDCHGLPTEVMVEKELGIKSKTELEQIGIKKFDEMCLEKVTNTEKAWVAYYRNLGAWRAYYPPYFTYKDSYIESGWWTAKQLYEKGLMVEGEKPIHWCSHCETSLSGYEVSDSYKEVSDPSIFVKFPVKGKEKEFLLVWTTTPWTLPANVAVAVKGDETYVKVRYSGEILILAKPRMDAVFTELLHADAAEYQIVEEFDGSALEGLEYVPLLDTPSQQKLAGKNAHKVILSVKVMMNKKYKKKMAKEDTRTEEEKTADEKAAAQKAAKTAQADQNGAIAAEAPSKPAEAVEEYEDFVTMGDGTGLVHCAPGCGQSDYFMGKYYKLPVISPVDVHGKFTADGGIWAGVYVKKADEQIMKHITELGLMLNSDYKTHRTTLCWRCKTPLIFRLSPQWYLKVDPLKEKMLDQNEEVKWYPAFGQVKFANWLSDREDWCISQQRYWGIPMPIWECKKCGAKEVIGSRDELMQKATKKPDDLSDLHRHTVDPIKLKCKCGAEMDRIPDIFNVWFDSGIAPWASLGYPFANKELFEKVFPVDLIVESQDQIRGWFDSLMFASTGVFGKAPYKQVGLMGWVLDEKGEKMSKSLGNVVSATDAITKLGADALRFYYCWEVPPWEVQKFSFKSAGEIQRFLSILYNSYVFFETYLPEKFKPEAMTAEYYKKLPAEDRFVVSAVNNLAEKVTGHLEAFEFQHAGRELLEFTVNAYSRWYVKLIRDRCSGADAESKKQAFSTIYYVLMKLSKLLAPLTPFIAEKLYQNLKRFDGNEKWPSVHFAEYPTKDPKLVDDKLEEQMLFAMQLTETANSLRQEAKIKLRWPVARIAISGDEKAKDAAYALGLIIASSTNAMAVSFATEKPEGKKWLAREFGKGATLYLDSEMTPELAMLSATRELTRAIQAARKAEGYVVAERIALVLHCADHGFQKHIEEHEKEISAEVGAKSITFGRVEAPKAEADLSELALGTVKASFTKA